MDSTMMYSLLTLGGVAGGFAMILYIVARRFHVEEDPRVAEVEAMLPGINCGACGFPGCSGLAEALVAGAEKKDLSGMYCPPGGSDTMSAVAEYFGLAAPTSAPTVAVLRCNGSFDNSPRRAEYDGPSSCAVAHKLGTAGSACTYSCLSEGDCVAACNFEALYMDPTTGLPVVIDENCTSCGACVTACPRDLFEIRLLGKGKKPRRVWIACRNRDRGAVARKNCSVACIACGKCVRTCDTIVKAISMKDNLAYIDPDICIACGKCVPECPTGAILATFPVKAKQEDSQEPVSTGTENTH